VHRVMALALQPMEKDASGSGQTKVDALSLRILEPVCDRKRHLAIGFELEEEAQSQDELLAQHEVHTDPIV
jgi:hypothetical protein